MFNFQHCVIFSYLYFILFIFSLSKHHIHIAHKFFFHDSLEFSRLVDPRRWMVPDPFLVINDVNVTSLLLLKIIDMLPINLILLDTLLFIIARCPYKAGIRKEEIKGAFLWEDPDQGQWFGITRVIVDQMNR